ncbi:MAG: U32 family peptidase [Clostridiales bacterium]|jgi:collagenase-like PrtC family protease|nr:U32 family peptidase [Clostridiales bacterium]
MRGNDRKPELLAPAGNADALRAAVRWGADAVYFGLKNSFNARAKADNFGMGELPETIAFARQNGVKVYAAFNTLIRQSELERAAGEALAAYRAGADALIVQDLGLAAELLRREPGVVLHASTQAGIHNAEGALYAKERGFRRVILSRETPIAEIRRIKETVGIEAEVFVHGALCVSFSGACYFSSVATGNSGNRGRCLQLCRKRYSAQCTVHSPQLKDNAECFGHFSLSKPVKDCPSKENSRLQAEKSVGELLSGNNSQLPDDKEPDNTSQFSIFNSQLSGTSQLKNGYLLSPADLCLLNELDALREAGVDCVKIEGRMRRPEYVAETVRSYRRALDGIPDPDALGRLKTVYNRGDYTTGYLYGVQMNFISIDIQGHKGLYAGDILRVNGPFLEVKRAPDRSSCGGAGRGKGNRLGNRGGERGGGRGFENGDAFKILRGGAEIGSAKCENGRIVYSGKPRPGDKLHITTSARLNRELNIEKR